LISGGAVLEPHDQLASVEVAIEVQRYASRIGLWRIDYNEVGSQSALGNRTPIEYARGVGLPS
jgi:hypothetical protein